MQENSQLFKMDLSKERKKATKSDLEQIEKVKQDVMALEFVEEQTTEVCLAVVKQNISTIRYVKDPALSKRLLKKLCCF